MKKWQKKRALDYAKQKVYFSYHMICEVCGRIGEQVHEIIPRGQGGRCTTENMITLCLDCHERCHSKRPILSKERLWQTKGLDPELMYEKLKKIRKGK